MRHSARFVFPAFCLLCCLAIGCSSNMTYKRLAAKNPMARNAPKVPAKMVDVWKNYAETSSDGTSMRGVGGRIHFYDASDSKKSIKVDGELTVFVFDGGEKDPTRAKPLRQYKFPADTLESHYSFKKPLGHGYDFFLPFDELGGEEKNLCIMTRFDDRLENALVMARPMNTILPGTKPASGPENQLQEFLADNNILKAANEKLSIEAGVPNGDEIRQVAFEQAKVEPHDRNQDRAVTTIALNDNLTRKLAHATGHVDQPPIPLQRITSDTLPLADAPPPQTTSPPISSRYDGKLDLPKYPDAPF